MTRTEMVAAARRASDRWYTNGGAHTWRLLDLIVEEFSALCDEASPMTDPARNVPHAPSVRAALEMVAKAWCDSHPPPVDKFATRLAVLAKEWEPR